MAWIKARLPAHGAIFLTHGEDEERAALRAALIAHRHRRRPGDRCRCSTTPFDLRAAGVAGVTQPAAPRIDPAQLTGDWHNAYAQFVIDLSDRLRSADSDARRLAIMKALESELIGVASSPVIPVPPPTKLTGSTAVVHGEPSGE